MILMGMITGTGTLTLTLTGTYNSILYDYEKKIKFSFCITLYFSVTFDKLLHLGIKNKQVLKILSA